MEEERIQPRHIVDDYTITVTTNTMVPEDGGYFAYDGTPSPDRTRGYGYTPWDAVKNLAELMEEYDRPLIKPCPFCGGEAGKSVYYSKQDNCVVCALCRTFGPEVPYETGAIERWNRVWEE
jgi:hypothetical protein